MNSAPDTSGFTPRLDLSWTPLGFSVVVMEIKPWAFQAGTEAEFIGFAAQTPTPGSTSGLTVANGGEYSTMGNSYGGQTFVDASFTYGDNFTWLKDKHTFKFGAQFLREESNDFSAGNDGVLGTMAYTGVSTANPNLRAPENASPVTK